MAAVMMVVVYLLVPGAPPAMNVSYVDFDSLAACERGALSMSSGGRGALEEFSPDAAQAAMVADKPWSGVHVRCMIRQGSETDQLVLRLPSLAPAAR